MCCGCVAFWTSEATFYGDTGLPSSTMMNVVSFWTPNPDLYRGCFRSLKFVYSINLHCISAGNYITSRYIFQIFVGIRKLDKKPRKPVNGCRVHHDGAIATPAFIINEGVSMDLLSCFWTLGKKCVTIIFPAFGQQSQGLLIRWTLWLQSDQLRSLVLGLTVYG